MRCTYIFIHTYARQSLYIHIFAEFARASRVGIYVYLGCEDSQRAATRNPFSSRLENFGGDRFKPSAADLYTSAHVHIHIYVYRCIYKRAHVYALIPPYINDVDINRYYLLHHSQKLRVLAIRQTRGTTRSLSLSLLLLRISIGINLT